MGSDITKDYFNQLLSAMVEGESGVSDLLFIPGRPPQMDCYGKLKPYSQELLDPPLVEKLADILMAGNSLLADNLKQHGSCDCSYAIPGIARFRVNIYRQTGHLAVVMRRLSNTVPSLEDLHLPPVFAQIAREHSGLVFVTGATGAGKTTTLAALLNELNRSDDIHIITLEDPIEYVHSSVRATFSQRELGRDFYNFSIGLKAALRQAPKAILVGEIRDRQTMEVAIAAAETGHVVFSTLHTISSTQTINRILGMFDRDEEQLMRQRLADTLRWVVGQRLVARAHGGLHLVTEVMGNNMRTRETILLGESDKRNLHEIIESSVTPWGWHSFEQSLLKAVQSGFITEDTAVQHSLHKSKMRQALDRAKHTNGNQPRRTDAPAMASA